MPASPRSWRLTDAYRPRIAALVRSAEAAARQTWAQIDPARLSASYQAGMLALTVTALQRDAARMSGGYVKAFLDAAFGTDTPVPVIDARSVGSARNGSDLRRTLDSPLIGVKARIRDGADPRDALHVERGSVERIAGLAVGTSARDSLAKAIDESPHIVGWQRVTHGGCAACLAAAAGPQPTDKPMFWHPGCKCTQEPIVAGVEALRPTGREMFDGLSRAQQDDVLGPEIAQAVRDGALAFEDVAARVPMATEDDFITPASAASLGLG